MFCCVEVCGFYKASFACFVLAMARYYSLKTIKICTSKIPKFSQALMPELGLSHLIEAFEYREYKSCGNQANAHESAPNHW